MKGAYFEQHGGPEVMQVGELLDPIAGPGEVLVDIHAASINAADWQVRLGIYGEVKQFPHILGRDFSGVVAALGEGVTEFKIGDAVFGVCDTGQEGAYAEKIAIKATIIASKPDSISHLEAAALGLTSLTALVSIEETLKLQAGETILIQGGAGGVAGFAIQLAKQLGAHVITTASAGNHDYVRDLGADEVINYHTQDFTKQVSNCDAVLDTVGGEVGLKAFDVLKSGGRAAFIGSGYTAPESPQTDMQSLRPMVGRDRAHLERIMELVEIKTLRLPQIRIFQLTDIVEVHRLSESRHLRGKLVFAIV